MGGKGLLQSAEIVPVVVRRPRQGNDATDGDASRMEMIDEHAVDYSSA